MTKEFQQLGLHPTIPMASTLRECRARSVAKQRLPAFTIAGQDLQKANQFAAFAEEIEPKIHLRTRRFIYRSCDCRAKAGWEDRKAMDLKENTLLFLLNVHRFAILNIPQLDTRCFETQMTYYGRWTYNSETAARKARREGLLLTRLFSALQ